MTTFTPPPTEAETAHEALMRKIAANPRFRLATPTGKSFAIGGQNPAARGGNPGEPATPDVPAAPDEAGDPKE